MNSSDKQRIQDLCSKSETYKKAWEDLNAMPCWKKEVYNTDFATAAHSIKIPIEEDSAMKYKDSLGNEIKIGDTIAYVTGGFNEPAILKKAIVVDFSDKKANGETCYSLKLEVPGSKRLVTLYSFEKCVVAAKQRKE